LNLVAGSTFQEVKMKKSTPIHKFACLLCLTLLYQSASAQIHKEWQEKDMNLFAQFQRIDRNDPKSVEGFFASHEKYLPPDTLGFGWVKVQKAKAGGYTRILADLYYFKDSLYSYVIFSYLPDEEQLVSVYKPILRSLFPENRPYNYSFCHGRHFINLPLAEFHSTGLKLDSSSSIQDYMSPESDIVYGKTGGIGGSVLPNRKAFSSIAHRLTASQIRQIMYSVNPASRLTAIEYYFKHKGHFSEQVEIEAWIHKVYKALPTVTTMYGCIVEHTDARKRVEEYVKGE
jgi:hypothetical protein